MPTQVDLPVKVDGKLYRFIANGTKAALFGKDGVHQKLTVTEAAKDRRIPKVANLDGEPVTMARSARPCSCKGAPWNVRYTKLAEDL